MKYYKQWTQFETQQSVYGNLRKAFGDRFNIRADYGQIFFWTKEDEPKLLLIIFVEASMSVEQIGVNELKSTDSVRRFRVCGSNSMIANHFLPILA